MRAYTFGEARALLAVDAKTARRWLQAAGIQGASRDTDKRVKLYTRAQLAAVARQHGRTLGDDPPTASARPTRHEIPGGGDVSDLEARVAALEAIIERAERRAAWLFADRELPTPRIEAIPDDAPTVTPMQPPRPRQRPPVRAEGSGGTFPSDRLWTLEELQDRYGVPASTVTKHKDVVRPAPGGPWPMGHGRFHVTTAYDDAEAATAARLYGGRADAWKAAHPDGVVPAFAPKVGTLVEIAAALADDASG